MSTDMPSRDSGFENDDVKKLSLLSPNGSLLCEIIISDGKEGCMGRAGPNSCPSYSSHAEFDFSADFRYHLAALGNEDIALLLLLERSPGLEMFPLSGKVAWMLKEFEASNNSWIELSASVLPSSLLSVVISTRTSSCCCRSRDDWGEWWRDNCFSFGKGCLDFGRWKTSRLQTIGGSSCPPRSYPAYSWAWRSQRELHLVAAAAAVIILIAPAESARYTETCLVI